MSWLTDALASIQQPDDAPQPNYAGLNPDAGDTSALDKLFQPDPYAEFDRKRKEAEAAKVAAGPFAGGAAPLPYAGISGLQAIGAGGQGAPFSMAPGVPPSLTLAQAVAAPPPAAPPPPPPGAVVPGAPPAPAAGPPPAAGDDEEDLPPKAAPASGTGAPPPPMGIAGPPPAAPAPAPAAPAPAAPAPAPEPSFLQSLSAGLKSAANPLMGVGAALQGDRGEMTQKIIAQRDALAQQNETQNLTARALLAKGVEPTTVAAAVRQPELLKALIGEHFGKSKYKVQQTGEDAFGGKTFEAINENDPTDRVSLGPKGAAGDAVAASGGPYLAKGVAALDSSKVGDEYLGQFSPEVQAAVHHYANGDSAPTGNPRKGWAENIKKIAQKWGDDTGRQVNDQAFYQKKNFLNSLGDTKSGVGMQVKGFQQGLEHLSAAADALEGLHNSGGLGFAPLADLINKGRQMGTAQEGQAAKAAGEIQALAGETGKLFSGSAGGGVGERAETRARFDTVKAPPAIAGALEGQLELMMGGLHSLEKRRDDIFGPDGTRIKGGNFLGADEQAKIDRVRGVIDRLRGTAAEAPAAAAGPVKPGKYVWTPDKGLLPK